MSAAEVLGVMVLMAAARRLRRVLAVTVMGMLVLCRGHRNRDPIYGRRAG